MKNSKLSWLTSIGLVLFTVHDFLLQGLFTGIGMILICAGMWQFWNKISLGSKWVWIPMLVIVLSAWARAILYGDLPGAVFLSIMFCLYLYSRNTDLLKAFPAATVIGAISVIIIGILYPGLCSAGILAKLPGERPFQTNYNIAAGFLVFGLLVYQGKYKWQLGTLVLTALFFTGASEALLLIGVLIVSMIVRRDWDWRKILITTVILLSVITLWTMLGFTQSLWDRAINIIGQEHIATDEALWMREQGYFDALWSIQPFGHGFSLFEATNQTIHNVPLIILYQLGPAAALAWTIATIYLLIHTKQKYLWVVFIAMGILDHYTWDNAAVWWWVIAGLPTNETYILKEAVDASNRNPVIAEN